jgi:hypothetical protein
VVVVVVADLLLHCLLAVLAVEVLETGHQQGQGQQGKVITEELELLGL